MASTAIKVSETLAAEARAAAADSDRSLTGQIEHWARIGKGVEPMFTAPVISSLKKCGGDLNAIEDEQERNRVLEALARFRSVPRDQIAAQLQLESRPRIEPDPSQPGGFLRFLPDGTVERGTLVNRAFIPR